MIPMISHNIVLYTSMDDTDTATHTHTHTYKHADAETAARCTLIYTTHVVSCRDTTLKAHMTSCVWCACHPDISGNLMHSTS